MKRLLSGLSNLAYLETPPFRRIRLRNLTKNKRAKKVDKRTGVNQQTRVNRGSQVARAMKTGKRARARRGRRVKKMTSLSPSSCCRFQSSKSDRLCHSNWIKGMSGR